ncbi:hypothetical protein IWZ00DRAFT_138490 [Phyllosticta capitalensis]
MSTPEPDDWDYESDEVVTIDDDEAHNAHNGQSGYNAHNVADVNRHQEDNPKIDFPRALKSRIIKFKLCDGQEFLIHKDLLCAESEKFTKQLRGDFKEARTGVIENVDESPEYISIFFDYLYRDGWIMDDCAVVSSQLFLLARLYCLGERLGADTFQKVVLWKLSYSTSYSYSRMILPTEDVIKLLRVVVTELPTRQGKEPLCNLVSKIAASHLRSLRPEPTFRAIIKECPELASQILLQHPSKSNPPYLNKPTRFEKLVTRDWSRDDNKAIKQKVKIRE